MHKNSHCLSQLLNMYKWEPWEDNGLVWGILKQLSPWWPECVKQRIFEGEKQFKLVSTRKMSIDFILNRKLLVSPYLVSAVQQPHRLSTAEQQLWWFLTIMKGLISLLEKTDYGFMNFGSPGLIIAVMRANDIPLLFLWTDFKVLRKYVDSMCATRRLSLLRDGCWPYLFLSSVHNVAKNCRRSYSKRNIFRRNRLIEQ